MSDHEEVDRRPADARERAGNGKLKYTRPVLTEYGTVAKLTQGTLTTQSDGKTGGFKRKRICL